MRSISLTNNCVIDFKHPLIWAIQSVDKRNSLRDAKSSGREGVAGADSEHLASEHTSGSAVENDPAETLVEALMKGNQNTRNANPSAV